MENPKRLFLLDAYALIFRGYYAFIKRPLRNKEIETSAIFGFINSLLDILNKEKPQYLAVCFDKGGSVERSEIYPEYKSNRPETPEGITVAVPYIYKILDALNIQVIEKHGFEADDIIGTLAKKAELEGFKTFMVTSDKDYAQLVSENTVMYKPARSGGISEIWDVDTVKEKFGIDHPKQVIDFLGMMGDSVDNIPGLPGVGPKTAMKFIQTYGSIENLFQNLNQLKGKQKENISENQELGLLSKKLATINTEVPIEFKSVDYELSSMNHDALKSLFDELEFRRLYERFRKIYDALLDKTPSHTPPQNKKLKRDNPLGLVFDSSDDSEKTSQPIYQWIDTELGQKMLKRLLQHQDNVALSLLTDHPDPMLSKPEGLGICFSDSISYYLPLKTETENNLAFFRSFFESNQRTIITHDAKRLIKVFRNQGVDIQGPFFDVQLAHYLIDTSRSHDLVKMTSQLLNSDLTDLEEVSSSGKRKINLDELRLHEKTIAMAHQADAIWQLKNQFDLQLDETKSREVFETIETPLLVILADMEYEGVKIAPPLLSIIADDLNKDQSSRERQIIETAGETFNIGSPKELGIILFEKLKIADNPSKTKTGQYATNETELSKYQSKHPIIQTILEWRSTRVLLNTFIEKLPSQINPNTKRVHTIFDQTRAASGRLSSKNPNLQNIPIRNEKGREIRTAFIAEENHILLAADYSQIELRIIASLSHDQSMMDAFLNGQDIHSSTASKVFGIPIESITREQRSQAKAVNFGIIYGSSAQGLSRVTGIPFAEAKNIIDSYFTSYPNLKGYMEKTVKEARENRYTQTITGRRRSLSDIVSSNPIVQRAAERQAINTPIQGSAADIIKLAMIKVNDALKINSFKTKLVLQIHDELVFEVPQEELEIIQPVIKSNMESAYKLNIPLVVDIGYGDNWLEAH